MNNPSTNGQRAPWLLIIGLLLGGGLLVFMSWGSLAPDAPPGESKHLVKLTVANWQSEVVDSDVPVLVDFTAEWCGPCKKFAPTVNKLADRYQGKVKIAKFDVGNNSFDKGGEVASKYQIRSIPFILIFKGGQPHFTFMGGRSEAELVSALDSLL